MGAYGTFGQFGMDSANPVTKRFNIIDEDVALIENFADLNGLKGTRDHAQELIMPVNRIVQGPIRLQPNSLEWASFLPWMLCGTSSGSPTVTYVLGETAALRYLTFDRVTKVYTYDNCAVDMWRITARQFQSVNLELNVVGIDETIGNAGSFPSLTIDVTTKPFMLHHCVMTFGGSSYVTPMIDLSMNNSIDKDRFFNSQTLTEVNMFDRVTSFRTMVPTSVGQTLYNTGTTGAQVVLTFTNGSAVMTITMVKVVFPRRSPTKREGRREVMLPIEGFAYKSGTTASVVIALNPGP